MNTWFPRPEAATDIVCLGPSGELDAQQLSVLLRSPEVIEWRDKVGVSSPADGSAKPSTRLLYVRGWVFKTDTTLATEERAQAQAALTSTLKLAARVELWHPDKRWFLLRDEASRRWWPVSVCPMLTTLRSVRVWSNFARLWAVALGFGLERAKKFELGLDLGPANFGLHRLREDEQAELWYLDDEVYPGLELSEFAAAIVSRIPEWPANDNQTWREFGELLRAQLEPELADASAWEEVISDIREVPLAARWEPARAVLIEGILRGRPTLHVESSAAQVRGKTSARLTAVIADVHANLPALDAVIAAANEAGADSWLFLGDAVGYGPQPRECIARLASLPNFIGLRGNHDHMACFGIDPRINRLAREALQYTRAQLEVAERKWLMALPVEQYGADWLAVHGAPVDPQRFHAYVYAMSYAQNLAHLQRGARRLCFNGHTHVPMVYSSYGGVMQSVPARHGMCVDLEHMDAILINPGSVGQPRDGDARASFLLWERDAKRVHFRRCEYALEPVLAAIHRALLPEDLATRLELGR